MYCTCIACHVYIVYFVYILSFMPSRMVYSNKSTGIWFDWLTCSLFDWRCFQRFYHNATPHLAKESKRNNSIGAKLMSQSKRLTPRQMDSHNKKLRLRGKLLKQMSHFFVRLQHFIAKKIKASYLPPNLPDQQCIIQ